MITFPSRPVFATLLALSLSFSTGGAETFYVDHRSGDDAGPGSKERPFRSIVQAVRQTDGKGGEIHLIPEASPYRENIVIRKGGLAESPLVIDGHGAALNLGGDVTAGPWTDTGNGWRLERPVTLNDRYYVASPAFVNGLPVFSDHPKGTAPGAWHGGSVRYDEQGRMVLVFPKGLTPANSVVVLPGLGGDKMTSGVGLSGASHVTVRNLDVLFAPNDGFNFHGHGDDVKIERVKALFNGDQGVSAHESYAVLIADAEIAFNGTRSGGVTDINGSMTTYRDVRIHQNRGPAFTLAGARHLLERVVSFGNPGGNVPREVANLTMTEVRDLGPVASDAVVPVVSSTAAPVAGSAPAESDRLGRFLQYRPPVEPVNFVK